MGKSQVHFRLRLTESIVHSYSIVDICKMYVQPCTFSSLASCTFYWFLKRRLTGNMLTGIWLVSSKVKALLNAEKTASPHTSTYFQIHVNNFSVEVRQLCLAALQCIACHLFPREFTIPMVNSSSRTLNGLLSYCLLHKPFKWQPRLQIDWRWKLYCETMCNRMKMSRSSTLQSFAEQNATAYNP